MIEFEVGDQFPSNSFTMAFKGPGFSAVAQTKSLMKAKQARNPLSIRSRPSQYWDTRKEEVMGEYFSKADTNKNDKIFVSSLMSILELNDVKLDDDELLRIGELAEESGEITKENYFKFLKGLSLIHI